MTKINCGCIKCKYNKKGICTAKRIMLAHNSINILNKGVTDSNKCIMQEDSIEFIKLKDKMNKFIEEESRRNYANNSK